VILGSEDEQLSWYSFSTALPSVGCVAAIPEARRTRQLWRQVVMATGMEAEDFDSRLQASAAAARDQSLLCCGAVSA